MSSATLIYLPFRLHPPPRPGKLTGEPDYEGIRGRHTTGHRTRISDLLPGNSQSPPSQFYTSPLLKPNLDTLLTESRCPRRNQRGTRMMKQRMGGDEDRRLRKVGEEEEEHLAPADSTTIIPADEPVSPPEGTELIVPPPSTDITLGLDTIPTPDFHTLPPRAEGAPLLDAKWRPPAHVSPPLPIIWMTNPTQTPQDSFHPSSSFDAVTACINTTTTLPQPSLSIPSPVES
ncbi:hypothetical protein Tco_1483730 [Tanacetum coccineum]